MEVSFHWLKLLRAYTMQLSYVESHLMDLPMVARALDHKAGAQGHVMASMRSKLFLLSASRRKASPQGGVWWLYEMKSTWRSRLLVMFKSVMSHMVGENQEWAIYLMVVSWLFDLSFWEHVWGYCLTLYRWVSRCWHWPLGMFVIRFGHIRLNREKQIGLWAQELKLRNWDKP